jgi:hypothetical protein
MKRTQKYQGIRKVAARLAAVQKKARALGLFVDDRELLGCPGCKLVEDVTCNGLLATYFPNADGKPNSEAVGKDTGLRFVELPKGRFRCPSCGDIVKATLL